MPQPTFLYMEDFRAHLRVVHQRRELDHRDLSLFEAWPGSAKFIQHRPQKRREAVSVPQKATGLVTFSSSDLTQMVADGISRGMAAVMQQLQSGSQPNLGNYNILCFIRISAIY